MMCRTQGKRRRGVPGCVLAGRVAEKRRAPRFVQRGPYVDPIAEGLGGQRGVLGEPLRGVPLPPSAGVLQRLRKIPMVERGDRADAIAKQFIDEPGVEVQTLAVDPPTAGGLDPW